MLALVIYGIQKLLISLCNQRPEIFQIVVSLLRPGIGVRQDLNLVVFKKRLPVRFPVIPTVLGIGNIFHRQLCIRRYLLRECKILILIGVNDTGKLDVLPQHISRRTVDGKFHNFKAQHLAEHVDFLHDFFADQIHIGQTV